MGSARSTSQDGLRFIAPLLALWLVPLVALIIVVPAVTDREEASVTAGLPSTATVGSRENDYRQSVTAVFTVTEPQEALLPIDGLVTAVHISAGQPLTSTTAVISVDGAVLKAHVDDQPFYRDIGTGTSGTDLERLRNFLELNGISSTLGPGSSFSPSLGKAVREYQRINGFPQDGIFRPTYVVFVPPTMSEVQSVLVTVGALVATGDPVLAGPAQPVSLALSADSPLKLAGKEGPFALVVLDEDVPLSSLNPSPDDVARLYRALVDATGHGGPSLDTEGSTQTFASVMLRLPSAQTRGTVPNTAVYTAPSGSQCVFLLPKEETTTASPSVGDATAELIDHAEPVDGEIGLASVQAELVGRSVVRAPETLPDSLVKTCT